MESSHTPTSCVATASHHKINLAKKVYRAADPSAGPLASQRSATLAYLTPKEDNAPPNFENSEEELKYLRREDAYVEKQHEVEPLRTQVLGKATYQCGELLDVFAKPLPPKRTVIAKLPIRRATVLPPDYTGHKQNDLSAFICNVKIVLEFDAA
jgi:hypothetical protein